VPDDLFSPARLRTYRVLEQESLCDPIELQIVDRLVAGHLWLPVSLIEIGFRNRTDRAIAAAHPRGPDWLFDPRVTFAGARLPAVDVFGAPMLVTHQGTSASDSVREAARMAAVQLQSTKVTRDDVIAHLMLGFWIARCPEGLKTQGIDMWSVLAPTLTGSLTDPAHLRRVMNKLGDLRNRVAHHEPIVVRAKNVYGKNLTARTGPGLVQAVGSALDAFVVDVDVAVEAAGILAPVATKYLGAVRPQIDSTLAPTRVKLRAREREVARLRAKEWARRLDAYDRGRGIRGKLSRAARFLRLPFRP